MGRILLSGARATYVTACLGAAFLQLDFSSKCAVTEEPARSALLSGFLIIAPLQPDGPGHSDI